MINLLFAEYTPLFNYSYYEIASLRIERRSSPSEGDVTTTAPRGIKLVGNEGFEQPLRADRETIPI